MKDFLFQVKHSPTGDPKKKKSYGVVGIKMIGQEVWFVAVEDQKTFTKIPAVVCTFEGFGKKEK